MRWLFKVLLFLFTLSLASTIFVALLVFTAAPVSTASAQSDCGVVYTVQAGDTLGAIAAKCSVSLAELQSLNPAVTDETLAAGQVLNIPTTVIPPDPQQLTVQPTAQATAQPTTAATAQPTAVVTVQPTPGTQVTLPAQQPAGAASSFTAAGQATTYVVQFGDTMSAIAFRFGVTLQQLIAANPQISNPNLIFPGQVINIPGGGSIPPTGTYTVIAGDTMYSIARRLGVSVNALIAANPQISNPNLIFPGQQLNIPTGGTTTPGIPPTGGQVHTVQTGESLAIIAARYNVTVGAILAANPAITNPNIIYVGQQIVIPAPGSGGTSIPPTGGRTHIVRVGDTLQQIAWLYNTNVITLQQLNPAITNPNLIYPGQVIVLP